MRGFILAAISASFFLAGCHVDVTPIPLARDFPVAIGHPQLFNGWCYLPPGSLPIIEILRYCGDPQFGIIGASKNLTLLMGEYRIPHDDFNITGIYVLNDSFTVESPKGTR